MILFSTTKKITMKVHRLIFNLCICCFLCFYAEVSEYESLDIGPL